MFLREFKNEGYESDQKSKNVLVNITDHILMIQPYTYRLECCAFSPRNVT